jgi:vacuolar-type H+-ATPase subunit H
MMRKILCRMLISVGWGTDTTAVDRPRAYLMRTVTNLAINFKKRQQRQRAAYFGQWLPEPDVSTGADHAVEAKGNITYALLVLMESLTAKERAVFILKEAFDYDHREIAGILEMTEIASRKLLSRAKHRIGAGQKKIMDSDQQQAFIDRFLSVIQRGDAHQLEMLLREDIQIISDGGGKVSAGRHPVTGYTRAARMLLGLYRKFYHRYMIRCISVAGQPAVLYWEGDTLVNCQLFDMDTGGLRRVYLLRNPDKLRRLEKKILNVSQNRQALCHETKLIC